MTDDELQARICQLCVAADEQAALAAQYKERGAVPPRIMVAVQDQTALDLVALQELERARETLRLIAHEIGDGYDGHDPTYERIRGLMGERHPGLLRRAR